MYKQLGTFLKSKKYKRDLKMELELSKPDFVGSINKRIEDMEKTDHGIVIAGIDTLNIDLTNYLSAEVDKAHLIVSMWMKLTYNLNRTVV